MEIKNGTGEHMKVLKINNKKDIRAFFKDNPNSTKMECSKALKLSYQTVLALIKEIIKEDEAEGC